MERWVQGLQVKVSWYCGCCCCWESGKEAVAESEVGTAEGLEVLLRKREEDRERCMDNEVVGNGGRW